MTLYSLLLSDPVKRRNLEQVLAQLLQSEIAGKQGAEGVLIKGTYNAARKLVPDLVPKGITLTLPGLVADLESEYLLALQHKRTFAQQLLLPEKRSLVTKAILRAFDRVAALYPLLVPLYQVIRLRIEHHAGLALPRLGAVIQPFCS